MYDDFSAASGSASRLKLPLTTLLNPALPALIDRASIRENVTCRVIKKTPQINRPPNMVAVAGGRVVVL